MGQSTDALLMYGIRLTDEADLEYDEEADEGSAAARLAWSGDDVDGVTIESHCSGEYPMYIIAIKATVIRAWLGHPKDIDPAKLVAQSEWADKLQAFVLKYKLPTEGQMGWIMASNWN